MNAGQVVTDDDLHAYADDLLAPARRAAVAAYLDRVPEARRRVEDIVTQNQALRAAAAGLLTPTVPDAMKIAHLFNRRRTGFGSMFRAPPAVSWRQIAAALVGVFALGSVSGWSLHAPFATVPDRFRPLVEEAADSYAVYEPDRIHPVEISATRRDDLMSWVSTRLGRSVSAPETIAGYSLLGGRVVATSRGPAAMFMYDDRGKRLVMMICPLSLHGTAAITDSEPQGLAGVSWADRGVGYSLVAPMARSDLHSLGEAVRDQAIDKT